MMYNHHMMKPILQAEFQKAIDEGLVSCRKHPTEDLWILNYTPACQYSKSWNDVTCQCRGLVVNVDGEVVARPFRKFFNLSEHENPPLPKVPVGEHFVVHEKLDGSLGILYWTPHGPQITTRGSFESEQAKKASEMLCNKYRETIPFLQRDLTYLFEIICAESRVVVNYGGNEELVLLGVIVTATGEEIPLEKFRRLPFRQPQIFDVTVLDELPSDTANFEGYVVKFDSGLRVKVKLDDYVRLHKLTTGITPTRIWEMLAAGQDVSTTVAELPDEMHDEVTEVADDIRAAYSSLLTLHHLVLQGLQLDNLTRKEQASKIISVCRDGYKFDGMVVPMNSAVMFLLLDRQKEYAAQKAWTLVKPQDGNRLICKVDPKVKK